MARERRKLNPRSKKFNVRFAIHLRALLEKRKLTAAEFHNRLNDARLHVSENLVMKWLSGDRYPRPDDLEAIGLALGLSDYRKIFPP